jgi:uncharacterized protein YqeY
MADSVLKQQLTEAMKSAMRAKDKERLGTLRLALSEIKKVEVDERIDPDEARVLSILDKMVKQRRESVRQFEAGGRQDLADQETREIDVLQEFLPEALDEAELTSLIQSAIAETKAESMRDMGKVMALLKPQLQGKADMGKVSRQVKARLQA